MNDELEVSATPKIIHSKIENGGLTRTQSDKNKAYLVILPLRVTRKAFSKSPVIRKEFVLEKLTSINKDILHICLVLNNYFTICTKFCSMLLKNIVYFQDI